MYSITCIHCSAGTETLPAAVTVGICSMLMDSFCDAGGVGGHFGDMGGHDGERGGGGNGSFAFFDGLLGFFTFLHLRLELGSLDSLSDSELVCTFFFCFFFNLHFFTSGFRLDEGENVESLLDSSPDDIM